jgi:KDO2-lipid IV(A) lauroyltransferase
MSWLRWLAPATRRSLASLVGAVAWHLGVRRRVALDNLAHAFPEKSVDERRTIARGVYESLALAAVEAVTSDLIPDEDLRRAVEIADWKGLDVLVDGHHPVLIASARAPPRKRWITPYTSSSSPSVMQYGGRQ